MPGSNVELIQQGYDALRRGDFAALAELLDPQVEWKAVEPGPWDCEDRQQVLASLNDRDEDPGELQEIIDLGDRLIVVWRPRDGAEPPREPGPYALLITVRGSKIVAMRDFATPQDALEAAGR
jgi:ketosteroid isomerase-like protein